ncbi:MAG: DUF1501 domain-containing protein [Comamonadaceae bacterium]|nr:DUF1501 domain-containing protein [Comamonadaceae bacterium]
MTHRSHLLARRAFLQRMGQLSLASTAMPWAINLAAMGEAAAFNASDDYKALVCVFLYGGNDHGNTLVPCDPDRYAEYAKVRGGLATPRAALDATQLAALPDGTQYALAPQLAPLLPLFEAGQLAVQLNVGPLIQPTTLAQFRQRSVPLPPKLFSHNDQQSVWQSSGAEGAVRGWGGRMGDLALSQNGQSLFTCMSVTGNAVFVSGQNAMTYQIGTRGATPVEGAQDKLYGSAAGAEALKRLITETRRHAMEQALNRITTRSMSAYGTLTSALDGVSDDMTAELPDSIDSPHRNGLAAQLRMVARLISAHQALGMKRQVFMVSMGDFDLHDGLLQKHPALLTRVGRALAGFHQAISKLGLGANVTTFTASEFGRTLTSNGDGSDHGWGSHHFVMGGAVKGGRFYGQAPQVALGGQEDTGQGRLLPSTSVDQFAAALARWFGVSDTELPLVAPHIRNFGMQWPDFMHTGANA